ncbi:MAG: FecR domain-containing protein [Caulobacteraceae bacterium]
MTDHHDSESRPGAAQADASDWVVRLSQPEAGEADWLSFRAWLDAAPANRPAFDDAQALWLELDHRAGAVRSALDAAAPTQARRSAPPARRQAPARWIFAVAASLVVAVVGVTAVRVALPPAAVYQTGKAERLKVALADGSIVNLNSNSRISVRYTPFGRNVELTGDEAAFDVVHDPARPFVVAVNDARVRVLGTEFNIHSDGEDLAVAVRRGAVQVALGTGAAANTLTVSAGRQLTHRRGLDQVTAISTIDDAFSWRSGQLVYRSRPVAEVVRDLNRYFSSQVVLRGDRAATMNFSGVLKLDDEKSAIARLCELLPLTASPQNGAIVLQARAAAL